MKNELLLDNEKRRNYSPSGDLRCFALVGYDFFQGDACEGCTVISFGREVHIASIIRVIS
jgi:hypothetical protein